MKIKIKPLVDGLKDINANAPGEWYDLRAAEDYDVKAGQYVKIRLGVAIELPDGYEAIVAARSSTFQKWGILMANGIGVIDHSYCGEDDEWHFPAIAMRNTHVHKNDRICQFRIICSQPEADICKVNSLNNNNRGGFGSSGTN